MSNRLRSYGLTLLLVFVAALFTLVLKRVHLPPSFVVFTYLMVVIVSAWRWGYGCGIAATLISSVVGPYLIDPNLTLARLDPPRIILVLTISVLTSRIADQRRKIEAGLRQNNEDLDRRVREKTQELVEANAILQKLHDSLVAQTQELQRSNIDLARFAYVASHDMQEPLRMVGIYVELMMRRYRDRFDDDAVQFAEVISEGVSRLQALVRDLLAYAAMTGSTVPFDEPTNVEDLVHSARRKMRPDVEASGGEIEVKPLPRIPCNAALITQVFQNLLENSLKYRRDIPLKITVEAEETEEGWRFHVSDNGIGIHPNYYDRIFEPFKRLHGKEIAGSGIGLAVCRRIVEQHGGKITVESTLNEGSTFTFTIPKAAPVMSSSAAQ